MTICSILFSLNNYPSEANSLCECTCNQPELEWDQNEVKTYLGAYYKVAKLEYDTIGQNRWNLGQKRTEFGT